jgi:1-phosphofructokinase/6-phosphofructokinase 2
MFLCISPNPAVDKRITLTALVPGEIHRAAAVQSFPGGKAAHVAMTLKALGVDPHWIGLCGGPAGEQVQKGLRSLGIRVHCTPATGQTRTNLEILEHGGRVTEIREAGETVSAAEIAGFEADCKKLFAEAGETATVIFSGSLPPGAPTDLYATLISAAQASGCRAYLDTSGEPLRSALSAGPGFVKPNRDEAAALLHYSLDSPAESAKAVADLIRQGARSAALSLGSRGMFYQAANDSALLFAPALPLQPRSTVGCGDAALAGFAFALSCGRPPDEALRLAAACAAANCLADSPGGVRPEVIRDFASQLRVETFLAAP